MNVKVFRLFITQSSFSASRLDNAITKPKIREIIKMVVLYNAQFLSNVSLLLVDPVTPTN